MSVFTPAGDGARSFYRLAGPRVTSEVRVRRDGVISSARDYVEMYSEPKERLRLGRSQPWHDVLEEVPEKDYGPGMVEGALRRARDGQPSTVAAFVAAVRLDPRKLLSAARGFLLFVRQTHELLGYPGPVRVEALVSGGDHYLAAAAPPVGSPPHFYSVSEQTELRASVEAEQQDLAKREAELAREIMTRLAWHFAVDSFSE